MSIGFWLAILLQYYVAGEAFLSVTIGWILLGFSLVIHARELMSK